MFEGVTSTSAGPLPLQPAYRILVVRLGAMGDIIHTLPAVASLKHSFPSSHLTWVVEQQWAPLVEQNPYVDRVTVFERGNPGAWMRSWRKLRTERFDFAVDFQGLFKSAMAASMARPDRLFGFHQSQVRERGAALFYSDRIAAPAAHVVDRNLELAAATGAANLLRTFPLPQGEPEAGLPTKGFVLASPLAGWRSKQWPLAFYSQLAARVRTDLGLSFVLNGPPGIGHFSNVAGAVEHRSGLRGLIDATRRAVAVVGIDSGPLHLAAALGKPGVAIFGPTDPARNGPYGDSIIVLRSERAVTSYKRNATIDPSMREVHPDHVFEMLKAQLVRRSTGCAASKI